MDFYESYMYLKNHRIFHEFYFKDCLDIWVVKVNPENNRIEDDRSLNTKTQVFLETGPYLVGKQYEEADHLHFSHDPRLDCGADTFEEAIIKLAKLVKRYYH